jgi:hypothetical protein
VLLVDEEEVEEVLVDDVDEVVELVVVELDVVELVVVELVVVELVVVLVVGL